MFEVRATKSIDKWTEDVAGRLCIIMSGIGTRAGVVQWQYRSFPSFGPGFDSHRPLQILKDLRSGAGFHGFQNINFVAKLHGKFGADLFERNFASVMLTNNGRVYSGFAPGSEIASGTLRQSVDRGCAAPLA